MAKIAQSFRLEDYTIARLEKLVDYYTKNARENADKPFQKSKIYKTDVMEFLINKAYEEMESKEEEEWMKKNEGKWNE